MSTKASFSMDDSNAELLSCTPPAPLPKQLRPRTGYPLKHREWYRPCTGCLLITRNGTDPETDAGSQISGQFFLRVRMVLNSLLHKHFFLLRLRMKDVAVPVCVVKHLKLFGFMLFIKKDMPVR